MENPIVTNKQKNIDTIPTSVKSNAQIIETQLKSVDWKYLYVAFLIGFFTLLLVVFSFIVVVEYSLTFF